MPRPIGGNAERTYAYDLDNNRTSRTDGGVTTTFTYDRTDQLLTQAYSGGTPTAFLYDAFGNLTPSGGSTTAAAFGGASSTTREPGSGSRGNDHVKWPHLDHQNWPHLRPIS